MPIQVHYWDLKMMQSYKGENISKSTCEISMQPPYLKKRQKNNILSKFYSLSIVLYTEKKYLVNRIVNI